MRVLSRSLIVLLVAAVAASAALAHYAIDVVADFMVAHASFDDIAGHGSREFVAIVAVALAVFLGLRGLRLCCDAVSRRGRNGSGSGSGSNVVTLSPSKGDSNAKPPSWWTLVPFAAITIVAACAAVPLMEYVDARLAGDAIDGLSDAFGGSILLGLTTTALCAATVATTVFALVRWLLSHRERIVAAIASVIRRFYEPQESAQHARERGSIVVCRPRIAASRRGLRAPPRPFGSSHVLPNVLRGSSCYTHSLRRAVSFPGTSILHPAHRSRRRTSF